MDPQHSLLRRQLRRHLAGVELTPALVGFLAVVQEAYQQFDADRAMLERSLELSDKELFEANSEVRAVFERLIQSSGDGIFAFDRELRYIAWNPSMERLTGVPLTTVFGKLATEVFPDLAARGEEALYRRALSGETVALRDREHRAPDGGVAWIDAQYSPLRDEHGAIIGGLAVLRDITYRKQSEEALREARDQLELRVEERTVALARANTELVDATRAAEAANAAKSMFLANMSHELRTPLNAIIGYSEMLIEEAADLEGEEFVPDLEKIRGAGKHLLGLINDILDLSKIEAGKMDLYLEAFAVADMMSDVASTVKPLVEKNHNRLEWRVAETVGTLHGDLTKTRQILLNLLSNAAKFTEHGVIGLTADRESGPGGDMLVFRVSDTGIGLTATQVDKLFQPFVQADTSTTRKYGGTGLGLTITRHFCQMMGGDIRVESSPGVGTTFIVRMPAVVQDPSLVQAAEWAARTGTHAAGAATILVVDDDAQAREMVARILMREGHRVVTAVSGQEGLERAQTVRPDLITLDVMMPQMDGWAVLDALKAAPELAGIPVLMLSMVDERGLGEALGASHYLTKPVDRDQLLGAVDRLLAAGRPEGAPAA